MSAIRPIILSLFIILVLGFKPECVSSKLVMQNTIESHHVPGNDSLLHPITTKQGEEMVAFAKTLLGTPYFYASADPTIGFDCSGFVNYVANHFDLKVPRSSVDFTNAGITIQRGFSRAGDLILFTGTDTSSRIVGHIGIVISDRDGQLLFIHSSSGRANGVTISSLEGYYFTRFVKIIRLTV